MRSTHFKFLGCLGLATFASLAVCSCSSSSSSSNNAGPKDPTSPAGKAHPRLWLDAPTLTAMNAKVSDPSSAVARTVAKCQAVIDKPSDYAKAESQGDTWAFAAASCGLAYQVTKKPEFAAAGLTMFKALLDDYHTIGDGAGGDDVVTHDTGYAMRFFGPYSALAYDWMHDAPGFGDVLPHARARFEAWVDWYDQKGYLNDQPDSNYHAGYVFAKTLISIATAGEDPKADQYFSDVTNKIFKQDIIAKGLGPNGVLRGGDWAEGWQYGPLSVLEYSLAARALVQQGANYPEITEWERELAVRMVYGLTPDRSGCYSGGDVDNTDVIYIPEPARVPLAVILGPSSDDAAAWANHIRQTVATDTDSCPAFDALAEVRPNLGDVDFASTKPPPVYLAAGPGNVYMRSDFSPSATWGLFTAAPHVVPDHQNHDASNFVFSRGADHLIVDPTPYGSRSTLTGNALAAESSVDDPEYRPSQTPFSTASLAFVRTTQSGLVATCGDVGHAFDFKSTPSDVPFARRDWVYLPAGEVVTIDRVRTGDASRSGLMRFRTLGSLSSAGTDLYTATVGGSKLVIHTVARSGGDPTTRHIDNKVSDCSAFDSNFGACDTARIAVDEYALKLAGPSAFAVHVLDAVGAGDAPTNVQKITDQAALGAIITRSGDVTAVVASSAQDGAAGATFTYTLPGAGDVRHVVFDAPEDGSGKSIVAAHSDGSGNCVVSLTAGSGFTGHPLVFHLSSAADGCKATEETSVKMGNE